jgi:hypothetical protein
MASQQIICRSVTDSRYHIELFDALGKRLRSEESQSALHRIPTGNLANGIYTIRIISGTKSFVRSIPIVK